MIRDIVLPETNSCVYVMHSVFESLFNRKLLYAMFLNNEHGCYSHKKKIGNLKKLENLPLRLFE